MGNTERKITFTSALLIITFISGCTSESKFPSWMIGTWKTTFNGFVITEKWNSGSNEYKATTVWDDNGLKSVETIRLYLKSDFLVYQVTIDQRVIKFTCEDITNDTLIFSNLENDYPKRIVYTKPRKNLMKVWVDNFENDPNTSVFNFRKL